MNDTTTAYAAPQPAEQALDLIHAARATIELAELILVRASERPPTVRGPDGALSPETVADVLGLSKKRVLRAIRDGQLRAVMVCGSWRILPSDLRAFLPTWRGAR